MRSGDLFWILICDVEGLSLKPQTVAMLEVVAQLLRHERRRGGYAVFAKNAGAGV
jgi:hypothetical protein